MAVTAQMLMIRLEDLEPYAEARGLARACRALAESVRHADHRAIVAELAGTAVAVAACVAEALRAHSPADELRRFRDALELLQLVRGQVYEAYTIEALAPHAFDELMAISARCRDHVDRAALASRRRGLRRLDGRE
jgi:hypothetical protein